MSHLLPDMSQLGDPYEREEGKALSEEDKILARATNKAWIRHCAFNSKFIPESRGPVDSNMESVNNCLSRKKINNKS